MQYPKPRWIPIALLALAASVPWWGAGAGGGPTVWPAAQAQGVPAATQRERLIAELALDTAQQKKLDDIASDMAPRFAALQKLPPAQAAARRAPLVLERQQRINAMLSPDQRAAYELMQARAEEAARKVSTASTPRP